MLTESGGDTMTFEWLLWYYMLGILSGVQTEVPVHDSFSKHWHFLGGACPCFLVVKGEHPCFKHLDIP